MKKKITLLLSGLSLSSAAPLTAVSEAYPSGNFEEYVARAGAMTRDLATITAAVVVLGVAASMAVQSYREYRARASAETLKPTSTPTDFSDVIGAEKAKVVLRDVVQHLKDPEPYLQLGARLPRGILLEGPPGNGKTLLAKALAGQAGASFIAAGSADFGSRYPGEGAERLKALFANARHHAPCIIFIDEIDGIGARSENTDGAALDNNRTIAELLIQLDGLGADATKPVVLIGATNHKANIDAALIRSGRFDTAVRVEMPALEDRTAILRLCAKRLKAAPLIDFDSIAQQSDGFSGADLANLANQAALIAGRRRADAVQQADFDQALRQLRHMRDPERLDFSFYV